MFHTPHVQDNMSLDDTIFNLLVLQPHLEVEMNALPTFPLPFTLVKQNV
jgi:hypothetical protein